MRVDLVRVGHRLPGDLERGHRAAPRDPGRSRRQVGAGTPAPSPAPHHASGPTSPAPCPSHWWRPIDDSTRSAAARAASASAPFTTGSRPVRQQSTKFDSSAVSASAAGPPTQPTSTGAVGSGAGGLAAAVTAAHLEYEGSLTIDEDLLDAAGILPYEAIVISNLNNGERFMTYAINGKRGNGDIILNGPTARKAAVGDQIIIFCYEYYGDEEIKKHAPRIVRVNEKNQIVESR